MSNWLGLREDQRTGESLSALLWLELSSLEAHWPGISGEDVFSSECDGSADVDAAERTPSQASLLLQWEVPCRATETEIETQL